jgi:hypothetical protein
MKRQRVTRKADSKYMDRVYRPKLNQTQKKILDDFILKFLPSNGRRSRYTGNTLMNIHKALDAIFFQYAKYGISEQDILDAFLRLNYTFRGEVDSLSEVELPSTDGFYEPAYKEMNVLRRKKCEEINSYLIHISVSPKSVNNLWAATKRIPIESASEEKTINPRILLKKEIKAFWGLSQNLHISEYIPKYILKDLKNIKK